MSIFRHLIAVFFVPFLLGQACSKDAVHFDALISATTFDSKTITSIDVILDPGCFIDLKDVNGIEVNQTTIDGSDPFMTYYGCGHVNISTSFAAFITGIARATSPAGGTWSATFNNQTYLRLPVGSTSVAICVLGTQVETHMLVTSHAQQDVPVAEITIQVAPQ